MESKRGCCSSSVCCGVPVEKGCFIFSVINIIICSLAALGSVGFLIFDLYLWFDGESRNPSDMVVMYLFTGIAVGCVVGSAIALTFSGVLCVGLNKNNKRYILAYLVYGIITVILSVLGTVGFIWLEWGEVALMMYALIPLGVCVIYSGLLLLVYQTYAVFSDSEFTPVTGHKRLLNAYDS